MPSFDIVSEVDNHELNNAVDQANREIDTRFDFKGSNAKFSLADSKISLSAPSEFQLKQMIEILQTKLSKRGIDIACLDIAAPEANLSEARQDVTVKQGIEQDMAKKINKLIKESKIKVQSQIQGEKVRVTGKKRDDLQQAIAVLKEAEIGIPLQYNNFRD